MSEYSVKNISKLPMLFPEKRGGLARSLMLKVLAKLQVGSLTLSPGDRLLFCTDGLTDTLSDYRIAKTLYDPPPYLEGLDPMQSLIREALDGSGRDNLTAILVDCLPGESL